MLAPINEQRSDIAWIAKDRVGLRGIAIRVGDRVGSRKRIAYNRVNCRSVQVPGYTQCLAESGFLNPWRRLAELTGLLEPTD